jgi:hypothetical protein
MSLLFLFACCVQPSNNRSNVSEIESRIYPPTCFVRMQLTEALASFLVLQIVHGLRNGYRWRLQQLRLQQLRLRLSAS